MGSPHVARILLRCGSTSIFSTLPLRSLGELLPTGRTDSRRQRSSFGVTESMSINARVSSNAFIHVYRHLPGKDLGGRRLK